MINVPASLFLIDDDIITALGTSAVSVTDFSFAAFTSRVDQAMTTASRFIGYALSSDAENEFYSLNQGDELPLFRGIKAYLSSVSVVPDASLLSYASGALTLAVTSRLTYTTPYTLVLSRGSTVTSLKGTLSVQGDSAESYAASCAAEISALYVPASGSFVSSSIFLPSYYNQDDCTVTWVSADAEILDANGTFVKNGVMSLTDWSDRTVRFTMIVSYHGEQSRREITIPVRVISADERTDLLFTKNGIVIDGNGTTVTVTDGAVVGTGTTRVLASALAGSLHDSYVTASGLSAIDITLASGATASAYTTLVGSGTTGALVALTAQNVTTALERTFYQVTFSYQVSPTTTITATREIPVYVTGIREEDSYFDPTDALQSKFKLTDYSAANCVIPVYGEHDGYYYYYRLANPSTAEGIDASTFVLLQNTYQGTDEASSVRVLPSKVPTENVTVLIEACQYQTNPLLADGTLDPSLTPLATYDLTLSLEGIIHNDAAGIVSSVIYDTLVPIFDATTLDGNGDGWLTLTEAKASYGETINLRDKFISSISGLRFFTGITALNLGVNEITDLSDLSALYDLTYLDLMSNRITTIEDLAYLDQLTWLSLGSNQITSIEPLRHLPSLSLLDLYGNDGITDFSPLENYQNLTYLRLIQSTDTNTYASADTMYYLALLLYANHTTTIYASTDNTTVAYDAQASLCAHLIQDVAAFAEAYQTLWVPDQVTYDGTTYYLKWDTTTATNITFTYDAGTHVNSWVLTSPVVDLPVGLTLTITNMGSSASYTFARTIMMTLLKGFAATPMINIGTDDSTGANDVAAASIMTDPVALARLFTLFDANGDSRISYAERTSCPTNYSTVLLDWSSLGITTLEGIEYFTGFASLPSSSVLDLTGNTLTLTSTSHLAGGVMSDLERLAQAGILNLRLGGQQYDFSQLITTYASATLNEDGAITYDASYATSLKQLHVAGAYGLTDDAVLRSLFALYLASSDLTIYLESDTTAWDPFTTLANDLQALPSIYAFSTANETQDLFDPADSTDQITFNDANTFTVTLYDYVPVSFDVTAIAFYGSDSSLFTTDTAVTAFTYALVSGYDQTVFAKETLRASATVGARTIPAQEAYAQLEANFNENIILVDSNDDETSLSTVFTGRTLRTRVVRELWSTVFSGDAAASRAAIQTAGGYYRSADRYLISEKTLNDLAITGVTVDGTYFDDIGTDPSAIKGLHYLTNCTSLTIQRDAYFGTCAELANITSLSVAYSGLDFSLCASASHVDQITTLDFERNVNYFLKWGTDTTTGFSKFSYFSGLTTLKMRNCCVFDFTFLKSYTGPGFLSLSANATTSAQTDHNANDIGNSSWTFNTTITGTNNTYTTLSAMYNARSTVSGFQGYYIGTMINDAATDAYTPSTYSDTGLDLTPDEDDLFAALVPSTIKTLGLKKDGVFMTEGLTSFTSSGTLLLPATTEEVFKANYSGDANGLLAATGAYPITWSIKGDAGALGLTEGTIASGSYTVSGPGFMKITGVITGGSSSATFIYYVESTATGTARTYETAYASIGDWALKAYFLEQSITDLTSITSLAVSATITSSIASRITVVINGTSSTFGSNVTADMPVLASLSGLASLTSLTTLSLMNCAIHDLSPLSSMTSITSLTVNSTPLSEVGSLANMTGLTTLDLSYNSLCTIGTLPSGITSLSLTGNKNLAESEIADAIDDLTAPTSLSLYRTGAMSSLAFIAYLATKTTLTSVSIALSSSTLASQNLYADANAYLTSLCSFMNTAITNVKNGASLSTADLTDETATEAVQFWSGGKQDTLTYSFDSVNFTHISETTAYLMVANSSMTWIGTPYVAVTVKSNATNIKSINGMTHASFDATVWEALMSASGSGTTVSSLTLTKGTLSLRGVNELGLTSLILNGGYGRSLVITDVEATTCSTIKSLSISDTCITSADVWTLLNAFTGLTTIDFSYLLGVDYQYKPNASAATILEMILAKGTAALSLNLAGGTFGSLSASSFDGLLNAFIASHDLSVLSTLFTLKTETDTYFTLLDLAASSPLATRAALVNSSILTDATLANATDYKDFNTTVAKYTKTYVDLYLASPNVEDCLPQTIEYGALPVTLPLVQDYTLYGSSLSVRWSYKVKNGSSVTLSDASAGLTLTQDMFTTANNTITLTAKVYLGSTLLVTYNQTITIQDIVATTSDAVHDYFVEVQEIGTSGTYQVASSLVTDVFTTDDITTVSGAVDGGSTETLHYVDANHFFNSGRFLNWLQANGYLGEITTVSSGVTTHRGYLLRLTTQDATTSLSISSEGISSIEGVQLFANLSVFSIDKGAIVSIEPFRGLALSSFTYKNGNADADNDNITDFSPLYAGASRTTLVTFAFCYYTNAQVNDLSFLIGFPSLTTVKLYETYLSTPWTQYQGLYAPSFRYVVATRSDVSFYVGLHFADKLTSVFDVSYDSTVGLYRLVAQDDDIKAAKALSAFVSDDVVTYENGFRFATTMNTLVDGSILSLLPAVLDDHGTLYPVWWRSGTSRLSCLSYRLVGSTGSYDITVDGTNWTISLESGLTVATAGSTTIYESLTYDQVAALLENPDFIAAYYLDRVNVVLATTLDVSDETTVTSTDFPVHARILINGYPHERSLFVRPATLSSSDDPVVERTAFLVALNSLSSDLASFTIGDALSTTAGQATYDYLTARHDTLVTSTAATAAAYTAATAEINDLRTYLAQKVAAMDVINALSRTDNASLGDVSILATTLSGQEMTATNASTALDALSSAKASLTAAIGTLVTVNTTAGDSLVTFFTLGLHPSTSATGAILLTASSTTDYILTDALGTVRGIILHDGSSVSAYIFAEPDEALTVTASVATSGTYVLDSTLMSSDVLGDVSGSFRSVTGSYDFTSLTNDATLLPNAALMTASGTSQVLQLFPFASGSYRNSLAIDRSYKIGTVYTDGTHHVSGATRTLSSGTLSEQVPDVSGHAPMPTLSGNTFTLHARGSYDLTLASDGTLSIVQNRYTYELLGSGDFKSNNNQTYLRFNSKALLFWDGANYLTLSVTFSQSSDVKFACIDATLDTKYYLDEYATTYTRLAASVTTQYGMSTAPGTQYTAAAGSWAFVLYASASAANTVATSGTIYCSSSSTKQYFKANVTGASQNAVAVAGTTVADLMSKISHY